jgi:hypothetical protein
MEALIKISTEEFNQELFNQLQDLVKRFKNGRMTISLTDKLSLAEGTETSEQFEQRLLRSIAEMEAGKSVSFTMDSFEAYIKSQPVE